MVTALRLPAIFAGFVSGAAIGFAAEPKEPPNPKIEIRWVERFRVEGLTVDRSVGSSGDAENEYYPHTKPAMILSRMDIAEARLQQYDWLMNEVVVHHYSVALVPTKDARERLAWSCPGRSARVTVAVDGRFWGWDHYRTDDDADVSERWKAKNYSPCIAWA